MKNRMRFIPVTYRVIWTPDDNEDETDHLILSVPCPVTVDSVIESTLKQSWIIAAMAEIQATFQSIATLLKTESPESEIIYWLLTTPGQLEAMQKELADDMFIPNQEEHHQALVDKHFTNGRHSNFYKAIQGSHHHD